MVLVSIKPFNDSLSFQPLLHFIMLWVFQIAAAEIRKALM